MRGFAGYVVGFALLAGPAVALAQDSLQPGPSRRPRIELGAGASVFAAPTGGTARPMVDTRVGVRLTRGWSLEGLVHVWTGSNANEIAGFYRAQALWRFAGDSLQPFVGFGGAGIFDWEKWPEYQWTDYYTGQPRVSPAGSRFDVSAPMYPTASFGIEKTVASRLAVRAELTAAFGISDYGVETVWLPSVSLSVPLGRYSRRR